jgi:hypothetical protein
VEVVKLFLNLYPDALTSINISGLTPLHFALSFGAPVQVLQLLLEQEPKAIKVVGGAGTTVLHSAYLDNAPLDLLRQMIKKWPVACLFLAQYDEARRFLPFDAGIDNNAAPASVAYVLDATKDAVCALMEIALGTNRSDLPEVVQNHLLQTITAAIPGLQGRVTSLSGPALTAAIRSHLTPELVKSLLYHDGIQKLLKEDEGCRNLICSLVRMNKSGRNYITQEGASDKKKGVGVLDSISDSVDCLLLHLCENPSLCNRVKPSSSSSSTSVAHPIPRRFNRKRKAPG